MIVEELSHFEYSLNSSLKTTEKMKKWNVTLVEIIEENVQGIGSRKTQSFNANYLLLWKVRRNISSDL